jgi:hypothetical protein
MKLPTIDGRECVPVRLMPFLTCWQRLTPDDMAETFSWRHPFGKMRWWSKGTYQLLSDTTYSALRPRDWDDATDKLATLETTLCNQEKLDGELAAEWERRSVELLPAGVFVWRDELESEYARLFGENDFFVGRPGLPELSDESRERALNNAIETGDFDSLADTSMARLMTRPGDGELSFDPLLDVQSRRVIFEGFESLIVATTAKKSRRGSVNPPQLADQSPADDNDVGDRERTTLLNIIAALVELLLTHRPGRTSKAAVIEELVTNYGEKPGMGKRTLEGKFADADRSLKQSP